MSILLLLIGLTLLVFSGKYLVLGSVQIAQRFKISSMVVGLTVVAFGTSAPELLVSVKAAISGHPHIAIGNVIGSNIANIALVLALTALVLPIVVKSASLLRDWLVMFALSALFVVFTINNIFSRTEAAILFAILLVYIFYSIKKSRASNENEVFEEPKFSMWITIAIVIASCIGLSYGAEFLVSGASDIARDFGVDERTISISLVAFGTSVPELTTSLMAAFKKQMDISIGNIIGSNIFNIAAVLGITGMIQPIEIPDFFATYSFDMMSMLFVSLLLILLLLPLQKGILTRPKAAIFFSLYIGYIYLVITGMQLF